MRSVTAKKFYADISIVDRLRDGSTIAVTTEGKHQFIVTKICQPKNPKPKTIVKSKSTFKTFTTQPRRLRMTKELAMKQAVGDANAPRFDGVAFINSLKK